MCAKKYVLNKDVVAQRLQVCKDLLKIHIDCIIRQPDFDILWTIDESSRAASKLAKIAAYEYVLEPNVEKFYQRLRSAVAYSYKGMELIKRIPPEKYKDYIGLPSCNANNLSIGPCTRIGAYATGRYCEEMNRPFVQPKERERKWSCYFHCELDRQLLYNKDHLSELIPGLEACYTYASKNEKVMVKSLDVYRSILLKDNVLFHEKINKYLDDHPKRMEKDVAPDVSIGALHHCHTAMLLGMEVEIDHQFLPKELLLKPEYIREAYNKTELITEDASEFVQ